MKASALGLVFYFVLLPLWGAAVLFSDVEAKLYMTVNTV